MKSTYLRIIAAMLSIVMIVCCFASCKNNNSNVPVGKEPDNDSLFSNDDIVWDDPTGEDNSFEDNSSTEPDSSTTEPTAEAPAPTTGNSGSSSGSSGTTTTTTRPVVTNPPALGTDSSSNSNLSSSDMKAILNAAGYEYDAEQQVYYSTLNPWQRHFGFGDEYDVAAGYVNMRYTTLKIDFSYSGLLWRLQWWKGQYGVLEGAELGVYTKDPANPSSFYDCADDDHLMKMKFEYYRTMSDYNNGNMLFLREEQDHWWLTGFKFGYTAGSNRSVVKATIEAYDKEMADGIEAGLKAVKGSTSSRSGFVEYSPVMDASVKNFYQRNGNKFTVVWTDAGYENYQTGNISPAQ